VSSKRLLWWAVVNAFLLSCCNLSAQNSSSVQLAWDASPSSNVASYVVRYGMASGTYSFSTNVGNRTTATVTGLQAGQLYYLAVTAQDDLGIESLPSNEVSYQVPTTQLPPTIVLTSPAAGESYVAPASVSLAATVVANGQTINKVQFYNGTILLGEDNSAPYTFAWNNVAAGSYALAARAVYATSSTVISAAANVTVTNPPPTITLTSPIAGASYVSPATITLDASLTANGHITSKVQFYNGTILLGEDSTVPYSLIWSNVASGNYSLTARAIYGAGSEVVSPAVNVTVSGLPAPWQTFDLGAVGLLGAVSHSNGVFTVTGAGKIVGTSDSFRFVYQTLSADGEIQARLDQVSTNGANGSTGLMIRDSLTPGSRFAFLGMDQNLDFQWQRRTKSGGAIASTTSGTATPPAVWVRLVRTRNAVTGYKSMDSTTWTKVGSVNVSMARDTHIGFIVASGNANTLGTSVFSGVLAVP
jgi:sulfur relay (sulfurtransferase) complex TusBCD TusD component (DsrE family)